MPRFIFSLLFLYTSLINSYDKEFTVCNLLYTYEKKSFKSFRVCHFNEEKIDFYHLLLQKRMWPSLIRTRRVVTQGCIVLSLLAFDQVVLVKKFLQYVCYVLRLEKGRTLYLNNFVFPLPKILCADIGWKRLIGPGKEDFHLNFVYVFLLLLYVFLLFRYYFPL